MDSFDDVVVAIPARYNSSRFPGKALELIDGIPMIVRTSFQAASAVGMDRVRVLTDDQRIQRVVEKAGFRAVLTELHCETGTDRLSSVFGNSPSGLMVVNVQGDEPLIEPEVINQVIKEKKLNPASVINAYTEIKILPDLLSRSIPKVIVDANGDLIYMSRSAIPSGKTAVTDDNFCEHRYFRQVCVYAFSVQELRLFGDTPKGPLETLEDIEILRFVENGRSVKMVSVDTASVGVDNPGDIERIESILLDRYH